MFKTALAVCTILATASGIVDGRTDTCGCSTREYLNIIHRRNQIIQHVNNGNYYEAVAVTKGLHNDGIAAAITEVVDTLIHSEPITSVKLMSFAYQLWVNGGSDIIQNHFPAPFKLILGGKNIKFVNKQYRMSLKLGVHIDGDGDKAAYGDDHDRSSRRISWQFIPTWRDSEVTFILRNIDTDYYMKVAIRTDNIGDHRVYGSPDHNTTRHRFYLRPYKQDGALYFIIVSSEYRQSLKLDVGTDMDGDRILWSHNGALYPPEDRYKWRISEW